MRESFEDKIEEIDQLLDINRSKWQLDAIQWFDYDDVKQIIRIHINEKWDLWIQERPFKPWCRQVVQNQIRNLIRNHYLTFSKPCLRCKHYVSEDGCAFTRSKQQDDSCPDYAKWLKKKKKVYDVKLPLPLEGRVITASTELYDQFDYEKSADKLHNIVLRELNNERHKEVYTMLFLEKKSDEEVASKMGFKPESAKKKKRYKQLDNLKKRFAELAREILDSEDIIE